MKTIFFNVQSKGGAGKSMLTYFQALKHEEDKGVAFIDLDGSTMTSCRQLKFLNRERNDHPRVFTISIADNRNRIDRERLFEVIERCCETNFETIYIDFGAAESEQLMQLLSMDFSAEEFEKIEKEMNVKLVFNVIVAGGTLYAPCVSYLKRMTELLNRKLDLMVYINEFTFQNFPNLIKEVYALCDMTKGMIKEVKTFGNIQTDVRSGQLILENVKEGKGMASLNGKLSTRIKLRKELEKI